MGHQLKTIGLDGTNCYLIRTGHGYILVDTGYPFHRGRLEQALEREGCRPGNLSLIVMTHGDIDHTGNGPYLRRKYQAKIAMHPGDAEMCRKDGITRDRGKMPGDFPPLLILWLFQSFLEYIFRQMLSGKPFEPFEPDVLLEDGRVMTEYGWNANIIYTPGHSKGSISVLTEDGDLICGDLFGNIWGKILKSPAEGVLEKLNQWSIRTVYPGHGSPFPMERIMEKE